MKRLVLAALALVLATPASAYTSYLKPSEYWPQTGQTSIEAAYATNFFTPVIALPARSLVILNPDASAGSFINLAVGANATNMSIALPEGGTYRISTGEQLGPVSQMVGDPTVEGGWRPLAAGETPAEDMPTTTLQAVTLANVYITRGEPTRTVVDQPDGRLALHPITHPNQVLAAQGIDVELLFDGAPVPNSALVLYAAGDPDTKLDRFVATDEHGRAHFSFDAPGQYVIAARQRADAPDGSPAAVRSYTTTLTFEALAQLPETFEVRSNVRAPNARSRRRIERQRDNN